MLGILAVFIPAFSMAGAAHNLFVPLALAVGFSMVGLSAFQHLRAGTGGLDAASQSCASLVRSADSSLITVPRFLAPIRRSR
jgi:hypothetical protein